MQLSIRVERTSLSRAISYREDIVFEYQRWQPVMEWGNDYPGHLMPTDPGRWSSGDGAKYADSFDELVSPVPPDWTVITPFSVIGGESAWAYAVDFSYSDWYADMTPHSKFPS
jgi:vacuolar protein sorting-associated protein 13A/C